ncbi:uncharacterized protein LOC105162417 [Sesamum indicum]|uniref:Uncharacterized protein LOC105162417 n=1 Tax=Sesamum indicum TaxID=4182 RepID=A0A6I9TDI5_SESIN|nr:uncharacterized protein LOC105162417 [Sesamum indicum]
MAISKILLSLSSTPPPTIPKSHAPPTCPLFLEPISFDTTRILVSRRTLIHTAFTTCSLVTLSSAVALAEEISPPPPPSSSSSSSKSFLSGIANTKSWFQFYGDGFAIRVPPNFEDIMEPEDYNAGLSLYGDKAKPKTYAARFASPDGSEVLSVVVRPSNQLKITFLEAKDIADFGSLKQAARIFVPGGATLYSARTFKIKEEEGYRNYYFYEFGRDEQHVALVAAVNSGKAIIAGATAPQNKWDDDGVRLRSAAVSLTLL